MRRLFVAIDLPQDVKGDIAAMVDRHLAGARWVPIDQVHLTLRFIGDADERQFREIRRGLERVRGEIFSLTLKGIGHFPPGRQPRVLWVGVEESRELSALQAKIEQEIVGAGVEADSRRFSPHITIARLRETPSAMVTSLEERHRQFRDGPFPVEEFCLYSSTLSREGAVHSREAIYRL